MSPMFCLAGSLLSWHTLSPLSSHHIVAFLGGNSGMSASPLGLESACLRLHYGVKICGRIHGRHSFWGFALPVVTLQVLRTYTGQCILLINRSNRGRYLCFVDSLYRTTKTHTKKSTALFFAVSEPLASRSSSHNLCEIKVHMSVLFGLCGDGDYASFRMPIDKANIEMAKIP